VFSTLPRSGRIAWNSRARALLGGAAGGIALDDEQLAQARIGRAAVGQLAGQVQAMRDGGLALHLLDGCARGAAGAGGEDDAVGDRIGLGAVLQQVVLERGADEVSIGALTSWLLRRSLVWPWNCGSGCRR
jgi:hypothetical protein